ncbi:hypothetical protein GCM10011572_08410 [Pseudoduganella buxea]|uniref:Uncharacterized protein n=1 Tax=Pseudoduganella buxea TaxID=1949069 RepID=A0ABQ1K9F3_9BURK|nr:hypothetical protein GCM10011572_08410 [Pseudoduganella buxea]
MLFIKLKTYQTTAIQKALWAGALASALKNLEHLCGHGGTRLPLYGHIAQAGPGDPPGKRKLGEPPAFYRISEGKARILTAHGGKHANL